MAGSADSGREEVGLRRHRSAVPGLVLLVLVAAGFAWLTRHPDAELLRRVEEWPAVGSLARAFRRAYLPPEPRPEESIVQTESDSEIEWILPEPADVEALPYVWVQPGTLLHQAPDTKSPVLSRESSIRSLSVLVKLGDWYQVRIPRPGQRPLKAWVLLEDYQEPSPSELNQPDPVLPLASALPAVGKVAAARQLMTAGGREGSCGPHPLVTDTEDEAFVELCPGIVQNLEEVYRQRYGLQPVSPPAEAILLFRRAEAYRVFRDRQAIPYETNLAHASPAEGYIALFQGDRSSREIAGTLIHELTHLLNRRALGPALPPWLSEGLADDLAESELDESGAPLPGRLGGESLNTGSSVIRHGALAAAVLLQEALEAGSLPPLEELVEMDRRQFHDPRRVQLHYALSSFWIRYLLSGFRPELRSGFRDFLQAVAAGEPLDTEGLLARLGSGWQDLEPTFHIWLRLQFVTPPSEIGPGSE